MTEGRYTMTDLQKVAADARRPYAVTQRANLAKLEQLITDAGAKLAAETDDPSYWIGMRDGLRRAVSVIEGRG